MAESIFEKVKAVARIREVVEHFSGLKLDGSNKALCPFHSEDTPSFSVKPEDNIFTCFGKCGISGDAIDFVENIKGISNLEAAQLLAEFYRIDAGTHSVGKRVDKIPVANVKPRRGASEHATAQIKDYITRCIAAVGRTDYYKRRGLIDDTVRKFHLGFDVEKQAVVIPYSSKLEYYQTRSIEGKEFRKPKTEDAGAEPIYNAAAIAKTKGALFVVESPICALSIMQAGGAAVALCGTGGIHKLVAEVKDKKLTAVFVLSLDNDDAGIKAQQELANALFDAGTKFITYNVAGGHKDPNELLMADPQAFKTNVKEAVERTRREYSKLKNLFSGRDLQAEDIPPTRWIVHDILPEGLAILCAPSKYGKSWMVMQLCLAVTQGKPFLDKKTEVNYCAYFSLEDSKRRFKGRLNKLLNDAPAPLGFFGAIKADTLATGLFEQLTELIETHPKIGLIIIDTFQKVRGGQARNESVYGADYREMGEFKAFADKHQICLLLVHHLRKQDDDGDVFNRINGSMAIMGASDTTWVLARKKRSDENTTLTVTGRDVIEGDLIVAFDKTTSTWHLIGNAADEAARLARAEYEGNAVIKTIKALVEKNPSGWQGNCSEIKVQIYEQTGALYTGSADSVGRTISKYLDRLLADGITHKEGRQKSHVFAKRQPTLFSYRRDNGSED